ncbi:MAG: hypothetical protein R2867_15610 [Caldilineaceae bacterium]
MTFYVVNENEPITQAYRVFPGPLSADERNAR